MSYASTDALMAAVEPFVRAYRAMEAFQQSRAEITKRVEAPALIGGQLRICTGKTLVAVSGDATTNKGQP